MDEDYSTLEDSGSCQYLLNDQIKNDVVLSNSLIVVCLVSCFVVVC